MLHILLSHAHHLMGFVAAIAYSVCRIEYRDNIVKIYKTGVNQSLKNIHIHSGKDAVMGQVLWL